MTDTDEKLSLAFLALSDPTRRDMLSRLVERDLYIGTLAESYRISLPAISKHIQLLEKAGLVTIQKEGRNKLVKIEFDNFSALQIWLEALGGQGSVLDRLEVEIETLLGDQTNFSPD